MISYNILRKLVLEYLKTKPNTEFNSICKEVEKLMGKYDLFPTREEFVQKGLPYPYQYADKRFTPQDSLNISQIVWDLIIERIITMGANDSNPEWPFLRLTGFGHQVIDGSSPPYYDPSNYLNYINATVGKLDNVIEQYVSEGLRCFKLRLFFASAVMFGAAAEKAALLLLEAIGNSETDSAKRKKVIQLLQRGNLTDVFKTIESYLDSLIRQKKIPYDVHKSNTQHLLSLFEMVRVQRNDAVHPASGSVDPTKVLLTIQSIPVCLETTYRLTEWFSKNAI